jgi:hypothetical protein
MPAQTGLAFFYLPCPVLPLLATQLKLSDQKSPFFVVFIINGDTFLAMVITGKSVNFAMRKM